MLSYYSGADERPLKNYNLYTVGYNKFNNLFGLDRKQKIFFNLIHDHKKQSVNIISRFESVQLHSWQNVVEQPRIALLLAVPFCSPINTSQREL